MDSNTPISFPFVPEFTLSQNAILQSILRNDKIVITTPEQKRVYKLFIDLVMKDNCEE